MRNLYWNIRDWFEDHVLAPFSDWRNGIGQEECGKWFGEYPNIKYCTLKHNHRTSHREKRK